MTTTHRVDADIAEIDPDVIKLDLRLVQQRPSTDRAAIVSAVAAERERRGAATLAEGIETEEHVAVARTLGASLGQGWLWEGPGRSHRRRFDFTTSYHRGLVLAAARTLMRRITPLGP